MPTITCTPGGATDNSYITLANATIYFANTLREVTWEAYSQSQQERALIQATAEIENLGGAKPVDSPSRPLFAGTPYDVSTPQALHFPRSGDRTSGGTLIVPPGITSAVCEQAYWLLERNANAPLVDRQQLQAEGVRQIGMDGLSETYVNTGVPLGIAPQAWLRVRSFVQQAMRTRVGPSGARQPQFRAVPD